MYSCTQALRKITVYMETKRYFTPSNFNEMIRRCSVTYRKHCYLMTIAINVRVQPIMNDLKIRISSLKSTIDRSSTYDVPCSIVFTPRSCCPPVLKEHQCADRWKNQSICLHCRIVDQQSEAFLQKHWANSGEIHRKLCNEFFNHRDHWLRRRTYNRRAATPLVTYNEEWKEQRFSMLNVPIWNVERRAYRNDRRDSKKREMLLQIEIIEIKRISTEWTMFEDIDHGRSTLEQR